MRKPRKKKVRTIAGCIDTKKLARTMDVEPVVAGTLMFKAIVTKPQQFLMKIGNCDTASEKFKDDYRKEKEGELVHWRRCHEIWRWTVAKGRRWKKRLID